MVDDYTLSRLALAGDEDAFKSLYDKYHLTVYRMMYRSSRNKETSEDFVQDVFLQVFRKLHTFRGEAKFSTWLYRVAFNILRMNIRRNNSKNLGISHVICSIDGLVDSVRESIEQEDKSCEESTVAKDELDSVFSILDLKYKQVLVLRYTHGYSHDEVANKLGILRSASKTRQARALHQLRELLNES